MTISTTFIHTGSSLGSPSMEREGSLCTLDSTLNDFESIVLCLNESCHLSQLNDCRNGSQSHLTDVFLHFSVEIAQFSDEVYTYRRIL